MGKTSAAGRGFALTNILAVLVVLVLFAAVAISRLGGTDPQYNTQVAKLKNHLRYARMLAMEAQGAEQRRFWGISRDGQLYQLQVIEATADRVPRPLPGENQLQVTADSLNFSEDFRAVYFDHQGRPHVGDPPRPAPADITVTLGYRPIRILQHTGVIP